MDHLTFAEEHGNTMTTDRPPKRWEKVNRDWGPGTPIRWVPDADAHSLLENILDPDAPELIEPANPFQTKKIVAEAMRDVPRSIDFTFAQAVIVGWHLWGEGYTQAGLIWTNYQRHRSFDSLQHLRHMLAEAHQWPVKRIAAQVGRDHGNVGKALRQVGEKLRCPPGVDRGDYLRQVADRGLQKVQIRLLWGSS